MDRGLATIDHVTPKARGGFDLITNKVLACSRCNSKKGHLMPIEFFYIRDRNFGREQRKWINRAVERWLIPVKIRSKRLTKGEQVLDSEYETTTQNVASADGEA